MVSAIEASIGILKVMYKHYMDNNEDASFNDRHICIFNCKNKYQYFLKYWFDPNRHTVCISAQLFSTLNV